MIPGMRGTLVSHDALQGTPGWPPTLDQVARGAQRSLAGWYAQVTTEGGPAWPARVVFDRIAVPFCRMLGLDVVPIGGDMGCFAALLRARGCTEAVLTAFAWGQDGGTSWRESVRCGIGGGRRWCFSFAGPTLKIYDAYRTHSRRFVEFDLAVLSDHSDAFRAAWALLRDVSALDDAVRRSEQHRASVRDSLQLGVHDALVHLTRAFAQASRSRRRRLPAGVDLLDESLVVIYRILFLLFAEARGLVPAWHPVFLESYTIDSLRGAVETLPRPRGVWEALQAIARLAHRGCRAGVLRVPPFNGRLFSPADAPLADSVPLDDGAVRQALLSLTTRASAAGRQRIAYGDLGVEQLGGVYERVLDYAIGQTDQGVPTLVRSGRRKGTGTFYTPRSLTEYLVRRTLAPLVSDAAPEKILALRVLDPAMGSGAFLVAACRYLAHAYESALIREGGITSSDLSPLDHAGFRRTVAQRCLFGVDINPMSVQLARLSLWLTTMSGDRPLTFFDHHLRAGNSLVGASIADVRQRRSGRRAASSPLPLLDSDVLDAAVGTAVTSREKLRHGLEETLEEVRAKEKLFAELQAPGAPLARWKAIADLWCAGWFDRTAARVSRGTFEALIDRAIGRAGLSATVADDILQPGRAAAARDRFFHWELEFPEVFHGPDGSALERPGFDAIIGNPPWEMLRGDTGDASARARASDAGSALTRFARGSGVYHLQGGGHANLYQMFVERALSLLQKDGRLGLVLPSGFGTDHGCAGLRRHILRSTTVDTFSVVENREGLFPIHRALKFVLLTLTRSSGVPENGAPAMLPLRCGLRSSADFDRLPEAGPDPEALPVSLSLIEQLSGTQMAVPELRSALDARIAGRIAFGFPAACDEAGWGLRFGRELNATDDRPHFNTRGEGLPVVEGKQLSPFAVDVGSSACHIHEDVAAGVLGRTAFERCRVAYRDVASSTNKLTLIAAVLPAGTITTHTVFCLRTALEDDAQHFVAGMLNSFVANYMVRLRVSTHVTVSIVERLPIPRPERPSEEFRIVSRLARSLAEQPGSIPLQADLQGAAARLYGLDRESFAHVLSTFPLVEERLRTASMTAFMRTV
jgi:hypothetical protein